MIRNDDDRKLLERLPGMTVAIATPVDDNGELDADAFHRLIDRVIEGGAASIFALGWMGEQPLLSDSMRRQVMSEVVGRVAGRVPVIVGISEQSLPRTMVEARAAQQAGADILLAAPPCCYPLSQESLVDYFRQLSAGTELPMIVYNNGETGVLIGMDGARTVSRMPGIIGIKETSNFIQLQQMINNVQRPGEFVILSGSEYLFGPALLIGAESCTMGGPGNLVPQWCARMHRSAANGDWGEVAQQHRRLVAFCDALYVIGDSGSGMLDSAYSAVLAALSFLGYGSGRAVSPLPALTPSEIEQVHEVLEAFEVR